MRCRPLALVLLVAAVACKKAPEPAAVPSQQAPVAETAPAVEPPAGASPTALQAPGEAPGAAATATARPALADEDADAVVAAWLDAQNRGDFAAYSLLYGERFFGVKRAGDRIHRFDRRGWLADRQRMFAKAMTVTAGPRRIAATPDGARVTFQQSFASGNFQDRGEKVLVIVPTPTGLRIAREEMATSTEQAAPDLPPPLDRSRFGFVVQLEGKPYLLLGPAEDVTPTSAPTLLQQEAPTAAWVELGAEATATRKAWLDKDLVLFGPTGEVCRGRGGPPGTLARVVPHFGTLQSWRGEDGQPPARAPQVAAEVWELSAGSRQLAVPVVPTSGRCDDALWARRDTEPPPQVFARLEVTEGALRSQVLEGLRKLKSHARIQHDYLAQVPAPRPLHWDQQGRVQVVEFAGAGRRWVAAQAQAGGGCAEFSGELTAVWQVRETATGPVLQVWSPDRADTLGPLPTAAADVDGDGVPELIGPGVLWRPVGAQIKPAERIEVPNLDCPC